jgi:hypothetical protein
MQAKTALLWCVLFKVPVLITSWDTAIPPGYIVAMHTATQFVSFTPEKLSPTEIFWLVKMTVRGNSHPPQLQKNPVSTNPLQFPDYAYQIRVAMLHRHTPQLT